jgi:choline monooxygenase
MQMPARVRQLLDAYDARAPLEAARTPPSEWYFEPAFAGWENEHVFARTWQVVGRVEQLQRPGDFVTAEVAGEPIVVVRDGVLRGFYNVCRHHAARIVDGAGCARALHCPYHGWTYALDGSLRSTPGFAGAADFEPRDHGLKPVRVEAWEHWVFVCLDPDAPGLDGHLGAMRDGLRPLDLTSARFHERVSYELGCNWKVYVDNYLDGGYHVPFLHKELDGALDTRRYRVDTADRYCLQSCPTSNPSGVRGGATAHYFWLYPNLMINVYAGLMDVNLVVPVAPERCIVHFDYYFTGQPAAFRHDSIAVAHRVQMEDAAVCESVQRGLRSRSYDAGRLAPGKEAGEHLFHRLLHAGLSAG